MNYLAILFYPHQLLATELAVNCVTPAWTYAGSCLWPCSGLWLSSRVSRHIWRLDSERWKKNIVMFQQDVLQNLGEKIHSICIWFRNGLLLYRIYKFSFYNIVCPWHAALPSGSTRKRINTPQQGAWLLEKWAEELAAILWEWVDTGQEKKNINCWANLFEVCATEVNQAVQLLHIWQVFFRQFPNSLFKNNLPSFLSLLA